LVTVCYNVTLKPQENTGMNLERVMLEQDRKEKRAKTGEYRQESLRLEGGKITVHITITFDELFN
jgi:hypothetical protein